MLLRVAPGGFRCYTQAMNSRGPWCILAASVALLAAAQARAASPVWKITDTNGGTLFLGGSMHALRKSDYPLPSAFEQAFAKSDRLVFEDEEGKAESDKIFKSGEYPRGDSLKNHVDPRTYAYVIKFFGLLGVPEAQVAKYRPWALTLMLWSPSLRGLSHDLGVEGHFGQRARKKKMPVSGLVSAREHLSVFTGLSDRQSEGVLLLTFIPRDTGSYSDTIKAWKRGEADRLWRETHDAFSDYPAFGERILEARNRAWMPKIEGFVRSGHTYFVIVGMGHLGGPEGLLRLLKKRGYRVEQL